MYMGLFTNNEGSSLQKGKRLTRLSSRSSGHQTPRTMKFLLAALPVLYLNVLCPVKLNPHQPHNLTWQVINEIGDIVWDQSKITILDSWWPDLFPDACKLALGVPNARGWDVEGYKDLKKAPTFGIPERLHGISAFPHGKCSEKQGRSIIRFYDLYVCLRPHRD